VRIAFGMPRSTIPDQHGAAAIFPLRDGSLESVVFNRVVLDVDGETLFAGDQAWPARDRPALHHAVQLHAQIVMQPTRGMFLYDVAASLAAARFPARLRRDVEFAFLSVDLQAHLAASIPRAGACAWCCGGRVIALPRRASRAPRQRCGAAHPLD